MSSGNSFSHFEASIAVFTYLMNLCLATGQLPEAFLSMDVVPAWKEMISGKSVEDYRFFGLTEHASKILGRLVASRLAVCTDNLLRDSKFGFRKGLGCPEALLVL